MLGLLAVAWAGWCGDGPGPTATLVTVAPGDTLMASMGHSALLFEADGDDELWDWGAYAPSPDAPARFLRGTITYQLHRSRLTALLDRTHDRRVILQTLDLDADRMVDLREDIHRIFATEDRFYQYEWETDNCATRARDAIDRASGGALRAHGRATTPSTARTEGARHLYRWPILGFAWRFVTTPHLDRPLTTWERAMVPERLAASVAAAGLARATCVVGDDGVPAPIVLPTTLAGTDGFAPVTPPASWPWAVPGAVGSAMVLVGPARWVRRWIGLYGLVLTALGVSALGAGALVAVNGVGVTTHTLIAGPQSALWLWIAAGRCPAERAVAVGLAGAAALATGVYLLTPWAPADPLMHTALVPGQLACAAALLRRPPTGYTRV